MPGYEARSKRSRKSTDSGAEFKEVFGEMLADGGISQRYEESTNSLGVVDAAMRIIKITIAKTVVDERSDSWARALGPAIEAHNQNSHPALLGSTPQDVKGLPCYSTPSRNRPDSTWPRTRL